MIRTAFYAYIFMHAALATCHVAEQRRESLQVRAELYRAKSTYKKHLLWRKVGISVVAATAGTIAVALLDSVCNKQTYPVHESVKWWLACIFGSGFSTFYTLCLEMWPALDSPDKAYYIARLVLYYATIKHAYTFLKKPEHQHYFVDEFVSDSSSEPLTQEQHDTLFSATGSVTVYKNNQ